MLLLLAATAAGCADRATEPAEPAASTPPPRETPLPVGLAPDASPQFRAVTEALVAAMRSARIPGAALGILSGGREEHATVGLASLSTRRPVTPETLFQIGSLTKTYTATAIWRLIDDGKLQLQAPVRRYLRGLRCSDEQVAARVTVQNLLEHTAGWYGDDFIDTGDDSDALSRFVVERHRRGDRPARQRRGSLLGRHDRGRWQRPALRALY
ncbi:MAG: serine hydrolase domain-containing protein [Verrucomicrobiota bacterium]